MRVSQPGRGWGDRVEPEPRWLRSGTQSMADRATQLRNHFNGNALGWVHPRPRWLRLAPAHTRGQPAFRLTSAGCLFGFQHRVPAGKLHPGSERTARVGGFALRRRVLQTGGDAAGTWRAGSSDFKDHAPAGELHRENARTAPSRRISARQSTGQMTSSSSSWRSRA